MLQHGAGKPFSLGVATNPGGVKFLRCRELARRQRGREVSQLNLQYFGEELIVPSGALPLSFEAVCGGMML